MKKYKVFGEAKVWVVKEVEAENEQEAMMIVNSMIDELTADVECLNIKTIDGGSYKLDTDGLFIKWQEVEEK